MKKIAFGLAGLLMLAIPGTSAFASTSPTATGSANVAGGSLSALFNGNVDFGKVTLNGQDQTVGGATNSVDVTDATGTGAGWKVQIAGTPLQGAVSGFVLPAMGFVATKDPGWVGSQPSGVNPPGSTITPAGVELCDAGPNSGLGSGSYTVAYTQDIPAQARADNYSTTLTISIVTGP